MTLCGPVVLDIVQHFVERWNEIKKRKYKQDSYVNSVPACDFRSSLVTGGMIGLHYRIISRFLLTRLSYAILTVSTGIRSAGASNRGSIVHMATGSPRKRRILLRTNLRLTEAAACRPSEVSAIGATVS